MSAATTNDMALPSDDYDRLWTVQDAARFLSVSQSWVYTATRTGVLPAVRVGRAVRFDQSALRAWARGELEGRVVQLPRCR